MQLKKHIYARRDIVRPLLDETMHRLHIKVSCERFILQWFMHAHDALSAIARSPWTKYSGSPPYDNRGNRSTLDLRPLIG